MRKVIAVLILIGLGALLYFSPSVYKKVDEDPMIKLMDANIEEDEILPLAKAADGDALKFSVQQLQKSPQQIVTFNAKLMKVMYRYGDEEYNRGVKPLTDEEIALLVNVQRQYYHEDLIKANSDEELHVMVATKEVYKSRENSAWIVDYKVGAPVYDPDNPNLAVVQVTFIPNTQGDNVDYYHQYLVERVGENWFIKGWRGLDDASVKVIE